MIVGSQESVGDKYIDNICTKFCLNFEFYVVKMRSGNKDPNNHFIISVQKQPYRDVLQNRYS